MDWPSEPFGAILADPPWNYKTWSEAGEEKSAKQHYSTLDLDAIKALPVAGIAAKDCVLFMWVTDTHLNQGLEVIKSWGFTFKTIGFHWIKLTKSGKYHVGLGHWTRANPEICLLATRGSPKRKAKDVRRLIASERREHSRKPDEINSHIERLVDGPYLELFARRSLPGWTCWGDEIHKFSSYGDLL